MEGFGSDKKSKKKKPIHSPKKYDEYQILNQAINYHSEGNIAKASKYYQLLIAKGFKNSSVFTNYGLILVNFGKLKEAELLIRKAIKLNPKDAIAYSNLGGILKNLGKLKEAELSTRKAIELNPKNSRGHLNLGSILIDLGKLKEAELTTRKAIELDPYLADAHLNLGSILQDLGKLKEAELSTRKAIELNPNNAGGYSNLGGILQDLGELKEAELSTRKAIELDPKDVGLYSNLGIILKDIGKLKEAESLIRKTIKHSPNDAVAHSNLGSILMNFGKLKEAESSILKAIEINPYLARAFFSLSTLNCSKNNQTWKKQLFSQNILIKKSQKDQIDIYFARANILHKEKNYKDSARYLQLANDLKLMLKPSKADLLIEKSRDLQNECNKIEYNFKENKKYPQSIFIVGMPRSGSTLIESILSMNNCVKDLGEINILEESFEEIRKDYKSSTIAEIYWKKVSNYVDTLTNTTNKWLFNYQYAGLIAKLIPNVKIIHSFRNPLDNILSIYRANFASGNEYSSSLIDCTKVYLDHEKIMNTYKEKYRKQIYDLNYDQLVINPKKEIKSLISFLDWEWNDIYLNPHLNKRTVSTASAVQVRAPIYSKSIGGWKNYIKMLKPSINLLTSNDKYSDFKI